MIGSPDLVAFTKETDFSEIVKDPNALPEELSVPMWPFTEDTTPWSKMSTAKFKKDFILVSEFSEQVGPQPLLTFPPETLTCETFDLNHFSLRIMSVDYQTSLTGSPSCGSLKLNFVEDSKVVLGDSREGAFAFVYHLTLYDLEARGFVRPFCLAYVTSDENKIIQQFQHLSSEFSKVSECLKTGNRKNFANELEVKLRDLEYTRAALLREMESDDLNDTYVKCTNEGRVNGDANLKLEQRDGCGISSNMELDSDLHFVFEIDEQIREERKDEQEKGSGAIPLPNKDEELAGVEKSIQEYKNLLKQVTCYPTRKLRDSEYSPYEPDDLPHSLERDLEFAGQVLECNVFTFPSTPFHSQQMTNTSLSRFNKRLKTLEELCDDYFHQQALQQLYSIERTFRGDACYIHTQQICRSLLRNLKSTNFLFEDPCDLEEEASSQIGVSCQHQVQQPSFLTAPSILSEPVSLDSYTSCVEMVPIKLELGGNCQLPIAQTVVNTPFEENLHMTSSLAKAEMEIEAPEGHENVDYISTLMKTSISSGDSIEVLGTEKSFRSQSQIPNIPVDTALQRPLGLSTAATLDGLKQGRVPTRRTCSEDSIEVLTTTESILPEDLRASYPCAIDEESPDLERDEKDLCPKQGDKKVACVHTVGNLPEDQEGICLEEPPTSFPTITLTSPDHPVTLTCGGSSSHEAGHAAESNPLSLFDDSYQPVREDLSDCFSYQSTTASTTSECTFSTSPPGHKTEGGTRRRHGRVGRAALQFLRKFPFAVHAVFSLLSGRTLVVLGSEEAAVRRLVTALSLYMPHLSKHRENIQPWTSAPLQLTDLLNWKLVGFNRMCGSTHSLERYSRYLSILDVDQKTLLCPTYSGALINLLMDTRSHFKRGHTYFTFAQCVLSKLVTRAFLLTFSHGHTPRSLQLRTSLTEFHTDDKKTLDYLSELIKLHFMEAPPNILHFSYTTTSLFKP